MSDAERKFFEDTCCVCLTETATHYFHPCGHKNICKSCALKYEDNRDSSNYQKCPLCSKKYECIKRFDGFEFFKSQEEFYLNQAIQQSLRDFQKSTSLSQRTKSNTSNPIRSANPFRGLMKISPASTNQPSTSQHSRTASIMDLKKIKPTASTPNTPRPTNTGSKSRLSVANAISSSVRVQRSNQSSTGTVPKQRVLSESGHGKPMMKAKSMSSLNCESGNLTIVFTETVNARFISSNWMEGDTYLLGKATLNIQKKDVSAVIKNLGKKTYYQFQLVKVAKLLELTINDDWLTWQASEIIDDGYVYRVDVGNLQSLIQQKVSEQPNASFYSLEAFSYKIKALDNMKSCPLLLSPTWTSDNLKTQLKLNYKYNPESMANPSPLNKVNISVHIASGFDDVGMDPVAHEWLDQEDKVTWNLDTIGAARSKGSIRAEFQLNDKPTQFGTVKVEFRSEGNSLSGVQLRSESFPIGTIKMRVFAGKYVCEERPTEQS